MIPEYYVVRTGDNQMLPADIRQATLEDFKATQQNCWQTNWLSDYIQNSSLEKYALTIRETHELIGLGAYRNIPEGVLVYVEYIESAPTSNPTISTTKKYMGIGAALLAFGVQLSIDYGYGGAIYLKAKTTEIREHYIRNFGALPFSRVDPFLLLIDGEAARALFMNYLKEG